MPDFYGGSIATVTGASIAAQLGQNETPGGPIDGSNFTFTTAYAFLPGTLQVYLNGDAQNPGASNDYLEGDGFFALTIAPKPGDVLLCSYIKP